VLRARAVVVGPQHDGDDNLAVQSAEASISASMKRPLASSPIVALNASSN